MTFAEDRAEHRRHQAFLKEPVVDKARREEWVKDVVCAQIAYFGREDIDHAIRIVSRIQDRLKEER